ncbi:hypothetical protein YC2023_026401 [Brassica napus]
MYIFLERIGQPSFKAVQGCLKRCNNLWSRHGRVLHGHVLFIREDNCGTDVVGKVFNAEDTNRRTYSCTTNNAFDHTVVTGGPSSSNAKTKPEEEEVKFPWSRNPGHDNVVTPAQSETRKLEVVDEEEFEIPPLFVAKSRFGRRRSGREHTPVFEISEKRIHTSHCSPEKRLISVTHLEDGEEDGMILELRREENNRRCIGFRDCVE